MDVNDNNVEHMKVKKNMLRASSAKIMSKKTSNSLFNITVTEPKTEQVFITN
jgi:hypothetical protein